MPRKDTNAGDAARSGRSFYTIEDVAECLGVSTRTVRRWIDSRRLVAHQFGRLRRVSDADLATFLNTNRNPD
jgi:excisionase family DNA binding protein